MIKKAKISRVRVPLKAFLFILTPKSSEPLFGQILLKLAGNLKIDKKEFHFYLFIFKMNANEDIHIY
jgi:hypothetical protein